MWVFGLVPIVPAVVVIFTLNYHARTHGWPAVLWRWHTGHPLDGSWHTNATWTVKASKVLHPSSNASRWQKRPRLHRTAFRVAVTVLDLAALYGLFVATTLTEVLLAVVLVLAAAVLSWVAWCWLSLRQHHRKWVRPLHYALSGVVDSQAARPQEWLHVERDRTRAIAYLPPDFPDKPALKQLTEATMIAKLAIESPEPKWELAGARPKLIITQKPAPPSRVTYEDVRGAIEAADRDHPVIGLGRGGQPVALSLIESPHILLSIPTGGGKSTMLRVLIPSLLAAGDTVAANLDVKWFSHPWVKGGLRNVVTCQRIEDIHTFCEWLLGEIDRRNQKAWNAIDIEGKIHADLGPRIVISAEELNTLMAELRRYWRTIRGPGDTDLSPAVEGLNKALLMGRQVRIHVIVAGQRVDAVVAGGGAARENFGTRILGRYTPSHWKMLCAEVERMPPSSRHLGRVQVVTGPEAKECQVAELTGAQAVELATSALTPWPATLPLSLRGHVALVSQVGHASDLGEDVGTGTLPGTPPPLPPGRDGVRLSDAVRLGLVTCSLDALRKASQRPGFIEPNGWNGAAKTYAPADLREWDQGRQR